MVRFEAKKRGEDVGRVLGIFGAQMGQKKTRFADQEEEEVVYTPKDVVHTSGPCSTVV
jgi:hypothetical protein